MFEREIQRERETEKERERERERETDIKFYSHYAVQALVVVTRY